MAGYLGGAALELEAYQSASRLNLEDFERRYAGDRVPLSDVLLREKQSGVRSEWQSERVDSSEGSSKDVQVRWVGRVSHDS